MHWKARLPLLVAALWWGSASAIGFLAVPLLFAHASSPALAGGLAAHLFRGETWVGIVCGLLLLASAHSHCTPYSTVPALCQKARSCRATIRGATAYSCSSAASMPGST